MSHTGTKDDGGAAFPRADERGPDGSGICQGSDGMSLRDYFAGQALSIMLAFPEPDPTCSSELRIDHPGVDAIAKHYAKLSYIYADAMLRARSNGELNNG